MKIVKLLLSSLLIMMLALSSVSYAAPNPDRGTPEGKPNNNDNANPGDGNDHNGGKNGNQGGPNPNPGNYNNPGHTKPSPN